MDIRFNHGTPVYVLRACPYDDAVDLVATGCDHSVQVLIISDTGAQEIASFHLGARVSALAWSPVTISPSISDQWTIEIAAATTDFGLHVLTKSFNASENVFLFGGGTSGHHGKVNDMSFCGGRSEDSSRYVATVSDDKMLMVWDLHPSLDFADPPSLTSDMEGGSTPPPRPQPTAYAIAFPHPLTSVNSHPSTSKEFLVADCQGSIFLTDWRSDPPDGDRESWRHSTVIELVDPQALSDGAIGLASSWGGSVSWRRDDVDIIGAVYGSRFSIWDIAQLRGGKPHVSGLSFTDGGNKFRWCETYPDYFAISAQSPIQGAVIHVHNQGYPQMQPTVFNVAPRPLHIRDFDFLCSRGAARLAAAVGQETIIFSIIPE